MYLSAMGRGRGRVSPARRGASPLQGDGGGHLLRGREAPVTAQQNGFVWERVTITSPVWVALLGMSLSQSPQSHWALSPPWSQHPEWSGVVLWLKNTLLQILKNSGIS